MRIQGSGRVYKAANDTPLDEELCRSAEVSKRRGSGVRRRVSGQEKMRRAVRIQCDRRGAETNRKGILCFPHARSGRGGGVGECAADSTAVYPKAYKEPAYRGPGSARITSPAIERHRLLLHVDPADQQQRDKHERADDRLERGLRSHGPGATAPMVDVLDGGRNSAIGDHGDAGPK